MSERKNQSTTKERILDAAEALMLAKSFHSVGLNEILAAVNVPKGSFYHHFQSKEQFGVEMLRHYLNEGYQQKAAWLEDRSQFPDAAERFFRYLEAGMAKFLENSCRPICLVVKLCGEVATFSDGMRQELVDGFARWSALTEKIIREAQASGGFKRSLVPRQAAAVIGDIWLGAMLRAQVLRNVSPMRGALAFLKTYLTA